MTVGEFQQGGIMMLRYEEIIKVMKEKGFGAELRKLIQAAESRLKEIIEVSEEEIEDLQKIMMFGFEYTLENNELVFKTEYIQEVSNLTMTRSCKCERQPKEEKEFSVLAEFLEKNYTKRLYSFGINFYLDEDKEFKKEIAIFVKQIKLDQEFLRVINKEPEEYYQSKYLELRRDVPEHYVGVIELDL